MTRPPQFDRARLAHSIPSRGRGFLAIGRHPVFAAGWDIWMGLVSVWVCSALGLAAAPPPVIDGPHTNAANGHVYYLLEQSSWDDAEIKAIELGGHLMTINDAEEQSWIASTFSRVGGKVRDLWTGLQDPARTPTPGLTPDARSERFVWSSGEIVTYRHWLEGQPDNYKGLEYCIHLWVGGGPQAFWNDVGPNGSGYPNWGVVEVGPPQFPQITRQPADLTVASGSTATFHAFAGGNPTPALRWEFSPNDGNSWFDLSDTDPAVSAGNDFSGTRTGDLTITSVDPFVNYAQFRLRAENASGTVRSQAAVLRIKSLLAGDSFDDRQPITGTYYRAHRFLLGADRREPLEPPHSASLPATVWWSWVAPSSLPPSTPVVLSVSGVRYAVANVYRGAQLSSLQPEPSKIETVGVSRQTWFQAVPGETYQIVVIGSGPDPSGLVPQELSTEIYFELSANPLSFAVRELTTHTNEADLSVSFSGVVRVLNQADFATKPLRLRLQAVPGFSATAFDRPQGLNDLRNLSTNNLPALLPGQFTDVAIAGDCPKPDPTDQFESSARGWGVLGILEESAIAQWLPIVRRLLLTGAWPSLNGFNGPGGGVIRFDPGSDYAAGGQFALTGLEIVGPSTVMVGAAGRFTANATFTDDLVVSNVPPVWQVTAPATIDAAGLLSAPNLDATTTVRLRGEFRQTGLLAYREVDVTLASPKARLRNAKLTADGRLNVQLLGAPGRKYVVERSVDLKAWKPLETLTADGSGNALVTLPLGPGNEFIRARNP